MASVIINWKTSAAGVGSILLVIGQMLLGLTPSVELLVTGLGLIFAKDGG